MKPNSTASARATAASILAIDFLPQDYREQSVERTSYSWRFVVVGVAAVVLISVTHQQEKVRRDLAERLQMARQQQDQATQQASELGPLNAQHTALEEQAALLTYLRPTIERSRVLRALAERIPPGVRLEEVHFCRQDREKRATAQAAPPPPADPAAAEAANAVPSPLAQDLTDLRRTFEATEFVVSFQGVAHSTPELHAFLDSLRESPLFLPAQLEEISADESQKGQSRFAAHVVVRSSVDEKTESGEPSPPAASPELASLTSGEVKP